ncbi:MAG: nitrate/sulfonate/bicarbonate transporter permease [Clostridiales bacterium]|nr:nitrate/sulfonate/bicarbonate transporter permease [Clostridiales bacterium]
MKNKYSIIRAASVITFLLLWQMFSIYNKSEALFNPKFLPAPTDVLITAIGYLEKGTFFSNIWASLGRVLEGFSIGVLMAVLLGYFMAKSQILNNILDPIFSMISSVPAYAFMPLFIIWFGIGESAKITLIVYSTVMPMLSYTVQGVRSVDTLLIRSARSLGASELQVFWTVVLKTALPFIFNGMKVTLGLTFSALIVAEMMGADMGLGYIIVNARNWFLVADMFFAMVMIGALYITMKQILIYFENKLFKWKKSGMDAVT